MPSVQRADIAVVGAGIVGLAHAWMAARHGRSVVLFDRHDHAQGASIRNFGMIWPVGQSPDRHSVALRSRELWLELAETAGLWVNRCGSMHLAYERDELAVLGEFAERAPKLGYDCRLLEPGEVLSRSEAVRRDGLLGGLWSPTELCVDPRQTLRTLPHWLHDRWGVETYFATPIRRVQLPVVEAADGRTWHVDRAIICAGADFETLFPECFAAAGLRRCKLQMLRTAPQPGGWRIGPHLAGGLTLRHYDNFAVCPSLPALRQRIAAESPELDRHGIHVMASQNDRGEVILGDSHEYDTAIEPFDKQEIDDLILQHLRRMLDLRNWQIAERWHGIYAKHPHQALFTAQPQPGVHVVTSTGGAGMTMSFGLAEALWKEFG